MAKQGMRNDSIAVASPKVHLWFHSIFDNDAHCSFPHTIEGQSVSFRSPPRHGLQASTAPFMALARGRGGAGRVRHHCFAGDGGVKPRDNFEDAETVYESTAMRSGFRKCVGKSI